MSVRISDMTAANLPLSGSEEVELSLPGSPAVTRKTTAQNIANLAPPPVDNSNVVTALTINSGVVNIDCSLGDFFTLSLSANVTSITFTNLPGVGRGASKLVQITQGTPVRTVAWPAAFDWALGIPGTVSTTTGTVDFLAITSFDNGTAWRATLANGFV